MTDLQWAAGFFEGEGCVHIRDRKDRDSGTKLIVTVSNTELPLLERFRVAVGGVGRISAPHIEENRKPWWQYRASHRQGEQVLSLILPYMSGEKVDKAQAALKVRREAGLGGADTKLLGRPSQFTDMTSLWHDTVHSMLFGTIENGGIDYVANIDCIRYGNLLVADSMDYDFDLGRDLWLNRSRWTVLCRQYLDLQEVRRFLAHAEKIGNKEGKRGVVTNMFCNNVQREAKKHRWGNCMTVFTYRGHRNGQPTLTLHSRVSYIAYIGGADLAVAHVLARYISKRIRVPVSEFKFEWAIDALQLHAFKSLPMLYKQEYIPHFHDKSLRTQYPAFKIIGRWWDQIVTSTENGQSLESIKYGPLRRVTRRYREYIAGDLLPSVPVKTLDFSPLKGRR